MIDKSNYIWAISGLTEIIGEAFSTSTNDGKTVHWESEKEGYFFELKMTEDGELSANIADTAHPKIYAILGYCIYHRIKVQKIWTNWITEEAA